MSKNNQAVAHQYSNLYNEIKKVDINALRAFLYSTTSDIVNAIEYWEKKLSKLHAPAEEGQRNIVKLEILRLESLMLARTQLTVDIFNVDTNNIVVSDIEIIGQGNEVDLPMKDKEVTNPTTDANGTVDNASTTKEATDNVPQEKPSKPDAKIINMQPEKLKQGEIYDRVKAMLIEGKGDEALQFATKYLGAAAYIPTKKHHKPEKWFDARIKSWIVDVAKNIKPASIKNAAEKVTTASITPPLNAQAEAANGQPSTTQKENAGDAQSQNNGIKVKRSGEVDINLKDWDKVLAWAEKEKVDLEDWFEKEEIEAKGEGFDYISYATDDMDATMEYLTTTYGLVVRETPIEGKDENFFENQTQSLNEEIQLIEDLLKQCHELRGNVPSKPENVEEIKALITNFFSTREKEDYPEQDKLLSTIIGRPTIITTAKDFFSLISYPSLKLLTEKVNGEDEINLYDTVVKDIETGLAEITGKEEFTENLIKLQDSLITRLRGKILGGKRGEDKNVVNKTTFYTQYHVLDFVEQVADKKVTSRNPSIEASGEAVAPATSQKETENVSTTQEAGASEQQTEKTNSKNAPKPHACKTVDEAIMLVIKNGGNIEDALVHPFCTSLKNTEVQDPAGPNKIMLNDENFVKYITDKFVSVEAVYKASLTTYPVEQLTSLVSIAVSKGQTAEDFAKENVDIIRKNDKEFLSITGVLGDVESTVLIKSEEDFLNYVKEIYAIVEKTEEPAEELTKYKVSSIKSFKDFETQVLKKVAEEKMPLVDLKKWARENTVDQIFEYEKDKLPAFTSENVGALDTYLEVITKKYYQTPESKAVEMQKAKDLATEMLKDEKCTLSIYGIVGEIRKFCSKEAIDYNLKEILEDVLKLAEVHNKVKYDKYMSNKDAMEKAGMITKKVAPLPNVVSKEEKVVIKESTEGDSITNDNVKEIFSKTKEVKTEAELKAILENYRDYPAAILRAATFLISSQKQIKDMNMGDAEVNTWVMNLLKEKLDTEAEGDEETGLDFSQLDFDNLKFSSDKKKFKENLDVICATYEDSTELREQILKAIKEGEGAYTKTVAKDPLTEIHKRIKAAFERVENAANANKVS